MTDKSAPPPDADPPQRLPRVVRVTIWILLGGGLLLYIALSNSGEKPPQISYSSFRDHLEAGELESVTLENDHIRGELTEAGTKKAEGQERFRTWLPSTGDEELLPDLRARNVSIETVSPRETDWSRILLFAFPLLLLVGFFIFAARARRSMGGPGGALGDKVTGSRARLYKKPETSSTTFDDVAGANGAKEELHEVIDFLSDPSRFIAIGAEMPKGVLLVGPPGTGKTLLARAVAGEAGVPFFNISGSDFMEMYVGVGASRVRAMFKEAREASPSIVFIDEIDSIGRRRGAGIGGGHDEREQTLNQLLTEMDGFEVHEQVIIIAATNRPDILDPALQRPGRFDRTVVIDLPTSEDRLAILRVHARNKPLDTDDLQTLARGTPGFSGADLKNLLNEAALLAARDRRTSITHDDLDEARDKVLMGLRRTNLALTPDECRMLAYHEGGHALVAVLCPHADPIHKITIVPRGRAMGVTMQLPDRDRYLMTREVLLDRIAVLMGGRAAERLIFNTATTGAENDLKEATRLARRMVVSWGMSDQLGPFALDANSGGDVFLGRELTRRDDASDATAREVDDAVRTLLSDAETRAINLLKENRAGLDRVAEALLEHESISGKHAHELIRSAADIDPEDADPEAPAERHETPPAIGAQG